MASRGDMVLAQVDAHDRPVGTVRRKDALRQGAGFRVVHVLLFDEQGHLVVQQIARSHDRHPGFWGSSVAGYVADGETYEQAAARKVADELGLPGTALSVIGKTQMRDGNATKFITVFAGKISRDLLRPDPNDFQRIDFARLDQMRSELARRTRRFTPTFEHVLCFAGSSLDSWA